MSKERVPYLVWRDGRPRWVPGPELRARGFKGTDLKDASGRWLNRGGAITAAERLNAEARNEKRETRDEEAPGLAARSSSLAPHSMSALFDLYLDSQRYKRRAKRTRDGYKNHIATLRAWCGDHAAAAVSKKDVEDFHEAYEEGHGAAIANAILRTLKLAFNFAIEDAKWDIANPCEGVELAETEGRLVLFDAAEVMAEIAAADALGLGSIGDAILYAVITGQRQSDVLGFPDGAFASGKYTFRPAKTAKRTKRSATIYAPDVLKARIEAMQRRKRELWPNVTHTREIVCELTGAPYKQDGSQFRALYRLVRAAAGGANDTIDRIRAELPASRIAAAISSLSLLVPLPSLLEKRFADLRDTAVTWLFAAGCTVAEIATITNHSLKTVQEILDKHYFVRDDALSQSAAAKFATYLSTKRLT